MESGIQSVAVPASSRPRQDSVGPSVAATTRKASPLRVVTGGGRARAGSIMSTMSRPALYNNTGLNRSPVASPVAKRAELPSASLAAPGAEGGLDAIQEGRPTPARGHLMVPGQEIPPKAASILGVTEEKAKPFSMWRDLPVSLIAQWTILALHGTISQCGASSAYPLLKCVIRCSGPSLHVILGHEVGCWWTRSGGQRFCRVCRSPCVTHVVLMAVP